MSKHIRLKDFYIQMGGDDRFPDLDITLGRVSFRQGPGELWVLEAEAACLPSFAELYAAELCLAHVLNVPDLALHLRLAACSQTELEREYKNIEVWLLKHAERVASFEQRLFACGRLERLDEEVLWWKLPPGINAMFKQQNSPWLLSFWAIAGFWPLRLQFVGDEVSEGRALAEEQFARAEKQARAKLKEEEIHHCPPPAQGAPLPPPVSEPAYHARRGDFPARQKAAKSKDPNVLWGRQRKDLPLISLSDIGYDTDWAKCKGEVFDFDMRQVKSGNYLLRFLLAADKDALCCLVWCRPDEIEMMSELLIGQYVQITAEVRFDDRFEKDFQGRVVCIERAERPPGRKDTAEQKRVELHIHSKLSAKDACSNPGDIVRLAAAFGHEAVALTDHGVVQGFPEASEAQRALAKKGKHIKLIYGMEGYLVDDGPTVFTAPDQDVAAACKGLVCFELKTFGDDPKHGGVSEFTGRRFDLDEEGGISPGENLHVRLLPDEECSAVHDEEGVFIFPRLEGLARISEWIGTRAVIPEHGAEDLAYLRYEGFRVLNHDPRVKFNPPLLDLPLLERIVGEENEDDLSRLGVFDRLEMRKARFIRMRDILGAQSWADLNKKCGHLSFEDLRAQKAKSHHIILLVNDELGLYNLYRLVSISNLENFYFRPRIPRSVLSYFRAGLSLGAACIYGEVFWNVWQAFKQAGSDELKAFEMLESDQFRFYSEFYDYLEIQPLDNNRFLLTKEDSGVRTRDDLITLNRMVLRLGQLYNRPVCATCDSHFLNKEDDIYRTILMSDMGFGDTEQAAPLYFRTTDEMLAEFAYLGEEEARRVVIDNTRAVAAKVDEGLLPFPDGSFPPIIKSAAEKIETLTRETALAQYGRNGVLPESIEARVSKELDAIISNGYAVMYYIAHELVRKSNEDGYIVGSRGSVGSSVVATFCGITEVNPLQPHYICPDCHYYEEETSGAYGSGFDLPAKKCPECGADLKRDGQDIPFATFLGFKGNKQPDIDLNFSGEYQARAHAFIEEMFGKSHTFRAGTIQGYAEKQSEALVHRYGEDNGLTIGKNKAVFLSKGIQGIKVSTGQHPGGIVVVPKEREVYDFTPIQFPADKKDGGTVTTHFDFNAMHDTILKIDALGHDDPTMLKMLSDITGIKILDIPIPDEKVMRLFRSTDAIGIDPEKSPIGSATIGLPEVGTMMAREMIQETNPTRFYDLVQLSGLSHGTDVWKGNAQDLIRNGICTINEVIGCRDSIMTTLIYAGLDSEDAFKIMERVRKGKGLEEEQENKMREHQVPEWYIESCKKIKYLFPKAHAAAYSISTQRIAWFKVYYPEAYYCAWFTVRGDEFSADENLLPAEAISARRLEQRSIFQRLDKAEQKKFYILELIEEMQMRGIDFLPLDLEKSEASKFTSPAKGQIRPPLDVIPGISAALAAQICEARDSGGPFRNCEEIKRRCHIGDAALAALREHGLLEGIPESPQIDLMSWSGLVENGAV